MGAFERLWLVRKCGHRMGMRYLLSSILPLAVIFVITAVLVFSIIFITSVSKRIDRMIEVLGSGSIYVYGPFDDSLLPQGSEVALTDATEALLYASGGERAIALKGIEDGYFEGMRGNELGIAEVLQDVRNPIVISSSLSSSLSLKAGDRVALMVYESAIGRARPYLATVAAVFDSVYPQIDSRLVYAPLQIVGDGRGFEVLLPPGSDREAVLSDLVSEDIPALSSRSLYRNEYANIEASLSALYIIFALVSFLAAYFSADAAEFFMSRDKKDISELMLLGAGKKRIARIYLTLTSIFVSAALAAGALLGVLLSLLSPLVLDLIGRREPAFLDYYVRSFSVDVPWAMIALIIALSLLVSIVSMYISIRRSTVANIFVR